MKVITLATVQIVGVFVLLKFARTVGVSYERECSSNSVCLDYESCKYEDVRSLKWCNKEKSKVCCPEMKYYNSGNVNSYHRSDDKLHDNNLINKDYYETHSTKDRSRKHFRENDRYGSSPNYDFYEGGYSGQTLSREAFKIMKNYDQKECGVRKSFYGGNSAGHDIKRVTKYGEFPWQAAILVRIREGKKSKAAYKYICGATVLNPSLVLTAAHCIKGMSIKKLKVKLGDWNLKGSRGEIFPSINRKILKVILHDYYEPATFNHDLAILVLKRPVNLKKTPHISPVCLPPKYLKFDEYSKCYIIGWGSDSYERNYGSNILKVGSVSLMKKDCHHKLKKSIPSLSNKFFKNEISCITGSLGKDACIGDGGGAVVCPVSNKEVNVCGKDHNCRSEHYFLAGIISWGSEECGKENSVTVVTDVESHLEWVLDKAKPYGGVNYMYGQYDDEVFYEYGDFLYGDNNRYDYGDSDEYEDYHDGDYGSEFGYSDGEDYRDHERYNGRFRDDYYDHPDDRKFSFRRNKYDGEYQPSVYREDRGQHEYH